MRSKLNRPALVAACAVATLAASQCTSSRNPQQAGDAPLATPIDTVWTPQSSPEHIAAWARRRCGGRQECLERALVSVIDKAGVDKAMGALKILAARDGDVAREGHVYAHGIGIAAYRDPATVGEQFGKCTTDFQSGCYHGVIQGYFADANGGESGVTKAKLDGLCTPYRSAEKRWLQFQCAHGIGHGLMAVESHHLLRSLDACDLLGDHFERQACWGGAFMENVVNATNPHHTAVTRPAGADEHAGHAPPAAGGHAHGSAAAGPDSSHAAHGAAAAGAHAGHHAPAAAKTDSARAGGEHAGHDMSAGHHAPARAGAARFKALDDRDPLYPCTVVKEQHRMACYLMQTSAILFRNGGDFKDAAAKCQMAPAELHRTCFISLGRDANSYARGSRERAVAYCGQAPAEGQPFCIVGVVKNVVDVTADYRDGLSFCRLVPDNSKPACYFAVGQQISILDAAREGRERACATAAQGFVAECRRGANLPLVASD
ncbi:MAG TPA: hypothetical protein VEX86_16295 [Longimicrobium sp.]|nr:hypothetical protein [Longimicrobium sp.]